MKGKREISFIKRLMQVDISRNKVLLYALLVGLVTGLLSSLFRLLLTRLTTLRTISKIVGTDQYGLDWIFPIIFTFIGVWFSVFLVKKYATETAGSGIQEIEGALDGFRPIRWRKVLPVKFIASLFSLSSGLLLGREGPTVQIGANVGKMTEDIFKQPAEEDNPLISTGAAAGLASAFNAPFAGIIFVIEEMNGHFKFNFYSLAALMIGAGSADLVVRLLVGSGPVLKTTIFTFNELSGIWLFVLFGLMLSVVGLAFNKLLIISLDFFKKLKVNFVITALVIALVITGVGLFSEDMIGSGYSTITNVYRNSFTLKFLLVLFVVRFALSIVSYGSGVPGGIFTPLITLGVISGMLFGGLAQYFFPDIVTDPAIFGVAGMAGIFASTIRAPLTGLALSVEMTANYELILPLIFTAVTASVCTTILGNGPIYSILLKRVLNKQ
ncbi:H(+)/Cl(-) exchange transporter ClcA [Maribacter sp. Asnod2-G09]|uniref:H(+)/Cl(-) exchange transporter ClcA n=1 Tax=Maribacter sp. Asnod2-G09 TaxID=3160577 RepID=UPI00387097A1